MQEKSWLPYVQESHRFPMGCETGRLESAGGDGGIRTLGTGIPRTAV